jgi:hypothetical protein
MPTFTLSPGSGSILRGRVDSVPFQIAQTSLSVPSAPSTNRGYNSVNQILVTNIGIRAGGLSHSNGNARAKIFNSGGSVRAYSTLEGLPNVGTATPSSEVNFSFPGTASGVTSEAAILTGGVSYRFGMLGTSQASIVFARQANSYDIQLQGFSGIDAFTSFSSNQGNPAQFPSYAIMGTVTYIYAPSSPSTPSFSGSSTSSISFSYSAPGDNGGSSITGYIVEYKASSSGSWLSAGTTSSTSFTVSGLSSGTSYDFRVAATNFATQTFGNWSAYSGTLTASTEASAPSWTDNTLAAFSANIPYNDSVSALNADIYNISSGSLPSGISLSSGGSVSGTPTTAQQSYSFTIRATNLTNGLFIDQAFSGTVGGSDQPIKVYVGGSYPGNVNGWINGTVRVFNGSDWVTPIIKVYNGVSWVNPAS